MTEEQVDVLVEELSGDRVELRSFISESLPNESEEHIESLVGELERSPLD